MKRDQSELKIAFNGAGSMAEAIIRGLIEKGVMKPQQIFALNNSNTKRLESLKSRYGIHASNEPATKVDYLKSADIIVMAMKPKDAAAAFQYLGTVIPDDVMLVSVIAGMSISTMQELLQRRIPIVRTMPNTSSTIGLGATGVSYSGSVTSEQQELARTLFQAIGIVAEVEEPMLETVTGVSGSGPAYVYYFIEAMVKAGVEGGLSPESALELTVQTVLGAAQMVKHTMEDPAVLRKKGDFSRWNHPGRYRKAGCLPVYRGNCTSGIPCSREV